jgi:hypothetical protein
MERFTFISDADHYQFYLEDQSIDHDTSKLWEAQPHADRLDVLPGLIAVGTGRYGGDIPVAIEIHESQPQHESWEMWDHVVECSIEVHSGQLTFTNPESFGAEDVPTFSIAPGTYRARVYYGNLDSVSENNDMEGDDHYRMVLWSGTIHTPVVLKRKPVPDEKSVA